MSHQTQIEKKKYRNWVKGGLSMKYLKDGIEKFADDIVRRDHTRILQQIGHATGLICNACTLHVLKPLHTSVLDMATKRKACPRGQSKCNCLYPNKASCPNKICDAIYEEILNIHASSPPSPCFKNTDSTKWVTHPWEIAKCFINAPGYRDKQSAEEIDVAGLLHIFINNTLYQTSLSCLIFGDKSDAFSKVLDLRNKIFHSPHMELEDQDLNECFRNIVSILEDGKRLKDTQCAKEAVVRIKHMQNQEFIITTETEVIVLRDIVEQRINKLDVSNSELAKGHVELEEKHLLLEKRLSEVEEKHLQLDRGNSALEDKHLQLEKCHSELGEKHVKLEKGHSELEDKHSELAKGHSELNNAHNNLEKRLEDKHLGLAFRNSELEKRHLELEKRHSVLEEKHLNLAKEHSGLEREQAELAKGYSEMETRYIKLEKRHSYIDQRLDHVEKDVENLKEDLHKKRLKLVEKRLDARRRLADHLQKHYVKTSFSPLQTKENEIDIDTVYVKPHIQTTKKETTTEKQTIERTVSFTSYKRIFHSERHHMRRIYLLGEVGSGKSAFCKMMILCWCRSVKNDLTKNAEDEMENIETMKQFDFLFFLPLRRLQESGRIREMINWYYQDAIPEEILDDILRNVSEKCLILADGLDEWTPNYAKQRPQHVTGSLPYLDDIPDVTLITTSRPSAQGILNMAFTEFDLKITMCGIPAKSIELMTEKYLLSLSNESNKDIVLNKLNAQKIDHIEKTPLLLQQLIWMIANDIDVGHCLSDNYSSLVNTALKWTEEKDNKKKLKTVSSNNISTELHLPSQLIQYDAFWSNRNLLLILGNIAFDSLFLENNKDSQMLFGRAKLNRDGLDDDMIDMMLTTGLLTEDNCQDNTKQKTKFAFTHVIFQEYFAALYIASHKRIKRTGITDDTKQTRKKGILNKVWSFLESDSALNVANRTQIGQSLSDDSTHQPQKEDTLKQFFRRCSSVQSILQMGVVLRLLCGLAPEIILDVCEYIYQTTQQDTKYSILRDKYLIKGNDIPYFDEYENTTQNMHKLIMSCLLECNWKSDTNLYKVPVLDLIISNQRDYEYKDLLQYVIQQKVLHLSLIDGINFDGSQPISETSRSQLDQKDIAEFQNLQTIAINLQSQNVSETFMTVLLEHISKTNSIAKIKLITGFTKCKLPVINLRGHHQLQIIHTDGYINIKNVDTSNLEVIKTVHGHNENFIAKIIERGVFIPGLKHLELLLFSRIPDLSKFLSRNVTLNVICLRGVYRDWLFWFDLHLRSNIIDLSAHNKLQVLEVNGIFDFRFKSVNTNNLNTVITDKVDVLFAVNSGQNLTSLTLNSDIINTFCFTKLINQVVCSCSQLQEIELIRVEIRNGALEMNCGMRNLKRVKLTEVDMKQSTWIHFVDSLLSLSQSVTVEANFFWYGDERCLRHIQDNKKKFKLSSNCSSFKLIFVSLP